MAAECPKIGKCHHFRNEPRRLARFETTIADLGAFAAADYATRLDAWCRATLVGWGLASTSLARPVAD
jgi:hypothetical protein